MAPTPATTSPPDTGSTGGRIDDTGDTRAAATGCFQPSQ
jgi:hypothetical protein